MKKDYEVPHQFDNDNNNNSDLTDLTSACSMVFELDSQRYLEAFYEQLISLEGKI